MPDHDSTSHPEPANDDSIPGSYPSISVSQLAAGIGIHEDILLKRIAAVLDRRAVKRGEDA